MTKPRNTRKISAISKRSWAASALALLLACLLGCSPSSSEKGGKATQGAAAAKTTEADRLKASWVVKYAQRDETIGRLLGEQAGWMKFREMELSDAIDSFSSGSSAEDKIGKARAALELAEAYDALDRFYLDTEAQYIQSPVVVDKQKTKARLGFVELRRKNAEAARAIFAETPPKGEEEVFRLGRAATALVVGDASAQGEFDAAAKGLPADKNSLASACALYLGRTATVKDKSPFGLALSKLASGDYRAAAEALNEIDTTGSGAEPGPDIFLYSLLCRANARMALEAVSSLGGAEAAWLTARAQWHLGDYGKCAKTLVGLSASGSQNALPTMLFGVLVDGAELYDVARILRAAALIKSGAGAEGAELLQEVLNADPSIYTQAYLAKVQTELGVRGPLGNIRETVDQALTATRMDRIKMLEMENGEIASALLGARQADISKMASFIQGREGKNRDALDTLDSAHQKKRGYKPDFVNPPEFLVELSSAYAKTGQYAPATEILFELSTSHPAIRVGYESLKRLYASKTGGEAPPR